MKPCAIYLSPMKALTNEKASDWGTPGHYMSRYKVVQLTGDTLWSPAERKRQFAIADDCDIILMTSELLDSITRRRAPEFLMRARVLVVDEAHLLTTQDRGPALEAGLMRFTKHNPTCRIVLLSATMPNVAELGTWLTRLNGKRSVIISSTWRPVPSETTFVPHPDRGRYWEVENAKVRVAANIIEEYPQDRFLLFVHTKATGRALVSTLTSMGITTEMHSADLSRDDRLRLEAEFKKR